MGTILNILTKMNAFKKGAAVLPNLNDRLNGSLFGLFAGDAVAMPVHWMYNLKLLERDYGRITKYVAPLDRFEGSIMNKSNTGGAGRGSN